MAKAIVSIYDSSQRQATYLRPISHRF